MKYEIEVEVYIFACGFPTAPAPFIEKVLLSSMKYFSTFVKYQFNKFVLIYFWTLYSIPLIYVTRPPPVACGPHYCSSLLDLNVQ